MAGRRGNAVRKFCTYTLQGGAYIFFMTFPCYHNEKNGIPFFHLKKYNIIFEFPLSVSASL